VAGHIASVVQRRERVEDRHLDRLFEPSAQMIGVALALYLRAHARQQLVRVDRAHDIVVDPHIETTQQAGVVARLDDDHDRQMPGAIERANLGAEPQAVGMFEAEADDHEVEIAVGKTQQSPRGIRFALDMMF
jgi:hypothetical protein